MPRRYYYANNAQEKSQKVLKESRKGIKISQNEFETINEIVSPLVKQKQSLNHILTAHTEINVNERTLRNWINNGYMDAKDIDLPRKVSFKPKKNIFIASSNLLMFLIIGLLKIINLFVKIILIYWFLNWILLLERYRIMLES